MLEKMHNEELCNTHSSPNITLIKMKVAELTGNVAWMQRMRNAYMILVIKPEGIRPLGRLWRRLENNIRETGCEVGGCELESSTSGSGPVVETSKQSNDLASSIKAKFFFPP
jgi:hypothetical protein